MILHSIGLIEASLVADEEIGCLAIILSIFGIEKQLLFGAKHQQSPVTVMNLDILNYHFSLF